jgi:hypothetical protein
MSLAAEAPSAARIPNSCRRRTAFANVRFATFAQAINSTRAAAPRENSSRERSIPAASPASLSTPTPQPEFSVWIAANSLATLSSRAVKLSTPTPAASRATTNNARSSLEAPESCRSGNHTRAERMTPGMPIASSEGTTPTTVWGVPSMVKVRPTTVRSPLSCRRQ